MTALLSGINKHFVGGNSVILLVNFQVSYASEEERLFFI